MQQLAELEPIFRHIDSHRDQYVEALRTLTRQPSVSAQRKGVQDCHDLLRRMMENLGIHTRSVLLTDGMPAIYGELPTTRSRAKTLLLYNHYDVQPPEPFDEWHSDPFGAEVRDGRIYGRGVADDKAPLVARLMAIRALRDVLGELPLTVKFAIEGEEEIGSPHLPEFVEKEARSLRADGCLWEGGERDTHGIPEVYLGVKGICYVELYVQTATVDQHSMYAPILPNAVWRLIWALSTLKAPDERILIDGYYDEVAHPTPQDLALLNNFPFDEAAYRNLFGVREYLKNLSGRALLETLFFAPTCTVCGFKAGYIAEGSKTVNPREATAKVDFRLVPNLTPAKVLRMLRAHLDRHGFSDVQIRELGSYEPARTRPDDPIVRVNVETAQPVYGVAPKIMPVIPGSGPLYLFTNRLGIPVASGECISRADSKYHAPNEHVRIDDYIQGIKHVAAMLLAYAAT